MSNSCQSTLIKTAAIPHYFGFRSDLKYAMLKMRQVHRFKTKINDRYVRIDCIGSELMVLKVDVVAMAAKKLGVKDSE